MSGRQGAPPWWETLPHDFHREDVRTEAHAVHPFRVHGTAAVDVLLRTGVAGLLSATLMPLAFNTGRLQRELDMLAFYRDQADRGDRERIFPAPPRHVAIVEGKAPLFGYRPLDINARLLRFESPYQALNPQVRADYAQHHHNHRTVAQYWPHGNTPGPTLVFLHGFLLDSYWLNSLMFSLRWFWKQGYDVLLVTLPFHGDRQAPESPFSGFGYFAHGLAHVNEAMLQAVYDVRILIDYLYARGAPSVGLSGLSLGGYLSALTASVDSRLSFCIPNAPVVCPADMLMEWAPLSWMVRAGMRRHGITVQEIRHSLALHCPLTWQPALTPDRLLIIGGAGDRFTAPRYVRQLHRHWQGSTLHWFPGNHVMHLRQAEYLRLMRAFMDSATGTPRTRRPA